jgi:CDP-6-deoxy-D-xylo-4-hexulose-3-dehydrase
MKSNDIRNQILNLVYKYHDTKKLEENKKDRIDYAGRVCDVDELINLVNASLDFKLTHGSYIECFEYKLSEFLDIKYVHSCNSGSSANLLAFMALTSPLLGDRQIKRNDEVITVAACFPTTISPIINYGAVPVFVDITIPEYNINVLQIESVITYKTKAIMLAHTLGNPFNIVDIKDICKKHNLWLIEDNCDSLGSKVLIDNEYRYTGTIGDIGTSSFYPAHHITTGEGGAVYTNNELLSKIILSMRDWGRDCICKSGEDNTCNHRFDKQYGNLPLGYDHKYIYSHFGYNLKMTNIIASIGCAQLDKIYDFMNKRMTNFNYLYNKLSEYEDIFILPRTIKDVIPSWFTFMICVKYDERINRDNIVKYLESKNIQTRMLFSGNILKHPCFTNDNIKYTQIGGLPNTNFVMNNGFMIGVYPGLDKEKIDYIVNCLKTFMKR